MEKLLLKTFRPLLLVAFLQTCHFETSGQANNWLWGKSAGGSGKDQGFGITHDASGNCYTTGYFTNSISFGTTVLTSPGGKNIFVAKYDVSGNPVWAKGFGGSSDDEGFSICTDPAGNIIVAGQFSTTSMAVGSSTLTNSGLSDIFVIKLDASGNVIWARSAGGNNMDEATSVATDPFGNIFVTGDFSSQSISFGSTILTNAPGYDGFVTKYDPSGNVLWAKSIGGSSLDFPFGLCTDVGGNVFVCGNFGSATLQVGQSTFTFVPGKNMFTLKIDPFGAPVWVRTSGGNGNQFARAITCVSGGGVLMCGDFDGSVFSAGTSTFSNLGARNIFAVYYDGSGNQLWARTFGGTAAEFGLACFGEAGGNSYIGGYFTSPSITAGTYTLINSGAEDLFLAKLDASGSVLWMKSNSGSGSEIVSGICSEPSGSVWITGSFCTPSLVFNTNSLTCSGILDFYIAKLSGGGGTSVPVPEADKREAMRTSVNPNPFNEVSEIAFSEEQSHASLRIIGTTGEIISETTGIKGGSFTINRNDLPPGLYIYVLIDDKQFSTSGRFVIVE